MTLRYVELHCKSNFSFLEGASHPDELVQRASELGYHGLALTDRHSLAGAVRGYTAAKDSQLTYLVGAEIHPRDAPMMVLWPTDRAAYGQLCRLLTRGQTRGDKGHCLLDWDDVAAHSDGLLAAIAPPDSGKQPPDSPSRLDDFYQVFADRGSLLCELHWGVDDDATIDALTECSRQTGLPLLAAGNVHYHSPQRGRLHDCLTAIRLGKTIAQVQAERFANSERHLRTLQQLKRVYRRVPAAIERTLEVAARCSFRLDQLRFESPTALAPPGMTPLEHLKRLTWEGAKQRWPAAVPDNVIELLRHEIQIIGDLHYESYFLTVWDIVRFARSRGILCQGRGSAANSVVCYCLGITSIDPSRGGLLFERFISRERNEAPDIDVDFEHQRREEVLQYLYEKYGRQSAGMTAAVITYRIRSALRDVGKALAISSERLDALSRRADRHAGCEDFADQCRQVGIDPQSAVGSWFVQLTQTLVGFPRHLSQHTGGMVITAGELCELCPVENAAMPGRTVIQWDKDDLDEIGILKVDVLALGMLSAIRRCFDLIEQHHGQRWTLATLPAEDSATYDMICQADTIGVFQIESRAQMSMLPRLRPRCFYDLVIEIAIVRPGPIQGQMVHPFLTARQDPSRVQYPSPAIREVLEKTLGVPLFQEQAMRLAVVAAGFTPGEADQLRRAMAAWRRPGVIEQFRTKLLHGMAQRGLNAAFAQQVFQQIRGFGEYGFPESHAASFALLVYASSYLKRHYPATFCAALLNSQPMGFYAPAQLVADARRHGVRVQPADVNHSDWDCTLEPRPRDLTEQPAYQPAHQPADQAAEPRPEGDVQASDCYQSSEPCDLRLGLRMIKGLPQLLAEQIAGERRRGGRYRDLNDLQRRLQMSQADLARLADADALHSLSHDRRAAIWQSLAQEKKAGHPTPLLDSLIEEPDEPLPAELVAMEPQEEVQADYQTTGLSLKAHPLSFYRDQLQALGCTPAAKLPAVRDGRAVRVAGLVLLRQRPGTAKGVTFATLEDETGSMNLVFFAAVWKRHAVLAKTSGAWLVEGKLENRQGVVHVIVSHLESLSGQLDDLPVRSRDFR